MAEDTKTTAPAPETQPSATVTTVPPPEAQPAATITTEVAAAVEACPAAVVEKKSETKEKESEKKSKISTFVSFKEESYVVSELDDSQKKALDEFKELVQDALNKHEFYSPKPVQESKKDQEKAEKPEAEELKKVEAGAVEAAPAPEAKKEDTKVDDQSKEVKKEDNKVDEKPKEVKKDEHATAAVAVAIPEADKGKTKVEEIPKQVAEEAKSVLEPSKTAQLQPPKDAPAPAGDDAAKTIEAVQESVVQAPAPEKEPEPVQVPAPELPPEEVSIWGVPLLADERSDTILLKFLRARDFKVKDAFTMLKNTVRWRKDFGVDGLLEEDLGDDWDKVMFVHGTDKEGHPVCYNVYGEFMNKELYQKTFSDEEKRNKFIKWVIQSLEKSVRKLDFSPTCISSIVQVNDLSNSPGLLKRELRQTTDKALQLLQDNYPEFVAKQVFVNVPWWYLAFYTVIGPFLTQRSKSKFVISSPAKAADTLFKYIAPEQVPFQYGGLTCQDKQEFSTTDAVSEVTIKASAKQTVEFPVSEKSHFVWQLRVIGWDVSYGAEFVPDAEDGYIVIVQKSRKVTAPNEPVIFNGYKVGEPGKIVVTINNTSSKKKKLLYRSKSIPISG